MKKPRVENKPKVYGTYFIGNVYIKYNKLNQICLYRHYRDESYNGFSLRVPEDYWTTMHFNDMPSYQFIDLDLCKKKYEEEKCKEKNLFIYRIDSSFKVTNDKVEYKHSFTKIKF